MGLNHKVGEKRFDVVFDEIKSYIQYLVLTEEVNEKNLNEATTQMLLMYLKNKKKTNLYLIRNVNLSKEKTENANLQIISDHIKIYCSNYSSFIKEMCKT